MSDETEDDVQEPDEVQQGDEAEPELPEEETESAKDRATDPAKARHLHQNARALESAVASLLGERGGIGNVFVANSIGLVEAGQTRGAGIGAHGAVPTGPIPPEVLDSITATYVEPTNYRELRKGVRDRAIVLLRAPTGWGRTATALHLLARECAEGVDKLSPDTDLRVLSTRLELGANRGYLLEALDIDQAASLSGFALNQWRLRLERAGARMVVLVAAHTRLREREVADYLVEGAQRTDDLALVRSHFRAGLLRAGEAERDLDEFPEFTELVEEVLGRTLRAHDLADLGQGLCRVVLGEHELAEVRLRHARRTDSAFREWFDGLEDVGHRAFAIALAVLDGLPLSTTAEHAIKLAKALQAAQVPDRRDRARDVFAMRTPSMAERVEAEVATAVHDGELGSLTVDVVRYRDPHRPREVLEHVWREHPEAHAVVRGWLRALGGSADRAVRFRAGVAVGLLSLSEFDQVRRHVIERWADRKRYWERDAVLGALRLPSLQPEFQPLITRMVDKWLQGREATGRRTAAVAALGVLPIMAIEEAFKRLRRAANTTDQAMRIVVTDAVTNLVIEHDRLDAVLGELIRWSVSDEFDARQTAMNCVTQLCVYLQVAREGSAEPWPGFLAVADEDRHALDPAASVPVGKNRATRRQAVVALVARALEAPHYVEATLGVLQRWVETAQRDPAQREPLGALLVDVTAVIGDQDTIRFHLDDWAAARGGPREAVAALTAALDREENRP
ncbi:hypothetical protein KCV87_15745 [Actinosynnema pretiosum subsp. pretiosum]|uniref:LigA protein n=1 Tax=Actinosynnema pretiosum subsp. pretiosum TaxID=103721 RepID=A0AA45LBP5_9PSEU|nr:hypothetical protein APASM_0917 [Actinosynnema pretiosum subsp. pretiosum]QUF07349.1 hypothetical protein KCV87_15745 [Actinosynnema pretiosum subsp. pretiosum]